MGPILASLIYLVLVFASFMLTVAKNGKPQEGKHSVGTHFLGIAIAVSLLYWGGFFDELLKRLAP